MQIMPSSQPCQWHGTCGKVALYPRRLFMKARHWPVSHFIHPCCETEPPPEACAYLPWRVRESCCALPLADLRLVRSATLSLPASHRNHATCADASSAVKRICTATDQHSMLDLCLKRADHTIHGGSDGHMAGGRGNMERLLHSCGCGAAIL